MAFLSINFAFLFLITFLLYSITHVKFRNYYLLIASCIFIGWNNLLFLLIALFTTAFTFLAAKVIERKQEKGKSVGKTYTGAILFLLFIWILLHNTFWIEYFFNYSHVNNNIRETLVSSLIFPLGMSFYVFQAIGYLTDIYWQEEKAEKNIIDFTLYMLLFMKFLSGPIEKYSSMINQIKVPQSFSYAESVYGFKLIFLGLMKKLLIANYLSSYTAAVYSNIPDSSGLQLLMTCLIYPIELYADFSGYTDMALGAARVFGISLSRNFNFPFSAKSTTDFWRRWHMSLSFWVRDYVFIPLTAIFRKWNRAGIYFSLLITFTLLGLWHGIGMTFLIYGLIQGVVIALEMNFKNTVFKTKTVIGKNFISVVSMVRTYIIFAISLIFFKADSISDAMMYLSKISFIPHTSWKEMNIGMSDHYCIVAGSAFLLILLYEAFSIKEDLIARSNDLPVVLRWSLYFTLVFSLLCLGMFQNDNFIYLQF